MRLSRPNKRQRHIALAWFWAIFGVAGITEYIGLWDFPLMKTPIANSIPVLFAISVYANFATDIDTAAGEKGRSS